MENSIENLQTDAGVYMREHRSCFIDMIVIYVFLFHVGLVTGKLNTIPFALYTKNDVYPSSLNEFYILPPLDFSSLPSNNCCTISKKEY